MRETTRTLLAQLKMGLADLYGDRLTAVYLFGSYARNEADAESDVDVLIVLDRVDDYSGEIDRTSQLISDLSLQYNVSLSRVFASEKTWREDETLFFHNLRFEAVPT